MGRAVIVMSDTSVVNGNCRPCRWCPPKGMGRVSLCCAVERNGRVDEHEQINIVVSVKGE